MPGLGTWPRPFQPNVYAQMRWQEARHPCVKGTGVPWPRLQPQQSFPRLPLRRPRSKGCLLVSAPGAAAKGGVHQLTMQTNTRARAPSLSHRLHWMTWCRRPRLSACHQVFRCRRLTHWLPPTQLPAASSCGRRFLGVTKKMATTGSAPGAPS